MSLHIEHKVLEVCQLAKILYLCIYDQAQWDVTVKDSPQLLPSTVFPIHYSIITPNVHCKIWTTDNIDK